MQIAVDQLIKSSLLLKTGLIKWVEAVNQNDLETLKVLYHPKARVFPTFGSLKVGTEEINGYLEQAISTDIEINYGTMSYKTEENLVEGEYTFLRAGKADVRAKFAFKFDSNGLIIEHASAPMATKTWYLKSEVSVCTLLTSATVKSVLNESDIAPEENTFFAQIKRKSSLRQ